jgi:capsular polysaccharide biosynthesis protein
VEELELREYWFIIRKRITLVVAIPLIAALMSGVISFFVLQPQYEAKTTLLVNQKQDNNPLLQYQVIMANQALVKTYSDIIKSQTLESQVISQLHLPYTVDQLDKMVNVSAPDQSQVIQVTVTAPTQVEAAKIANTLASVFQKQAEKLMDVKNVQIVDPAVVDAHPKPVNPNKTLNITIAFIFGLMVSVGLAFLLEYLDNRLRDEEAVMRYLNLPVLGTVVDYTEELE